MLFVSENFYPEVSSNETGSRIHQYIKKETGCPDPYKNEKKLGNEIALSLMPTVRELLKEDNSLETYLKVAIVGNILDFGSFTLGTDMESLIFEGLKRELIINDIEKLEHALNENDRLLYLVDNTGEIVFDKLLIEKIKEYDVDVTVAVKEKPILNDACLEDALEVGLDEVADIINTGSDSVGVVQSMISDEFKQILMDSPLVISKGMGNYEGITEMGFNDNQDIFVLLNTKCSAISKDLGVEEGSNVLYKLE